MPYTVSVTPDQTVRIYDCFSNWVAWTYQQTVYSSQIRLPEYQANLELYCPYMVQMLAMTGSELMENALINFEHELSNTK